MYCISTIYIVFTCTVTLGLTVLINIIIYIIITILLTLPICKLLVSYILLHLVVISFHNNFC